MKVYLAAPLFSAAERSFNDTLCKVLEQYATVYLPQRDGELMADMTRIGISADMASARIFRKDLEAIYKCDYLLAVTLPPKNVSQG